MNHLDLAFAFVVLISVAIGAWRGLVQELFYVAGWVLAFIGAPLLGPHLSTIVLPELIADEAMRRVVAVGFAFVLILIASSLVASLASSLVKAVGLSTMDRGLGAAYGLVRAFIVLMLFVIIAGFTTLPRTELWRSSAVVPFARFAVLAIQPYLPEGFAKRINLSQAPQGENQKQQ
jgi:membrane protein required for colicin V production